MYTIYYDPSLYRAAMRTMRSFTDLDNLTDIASDH